MIIPNGIKFFDTEDEAVEESQRAVALLPDDWRHSTAQAVNKKGEVEQSWSYSLLSKNGKIMIYPHIDGGWIGMLWRAGSQSITGPMDHPGKVAMGCGVKLRAAVQSNVIFLQIICEELRGLEKFEKEMQAWLETPDEDLPPDNEQSNENDTTSSEASPSL